MWGNRQKLQVWGYLQFILIRFVARIEPRDVVIL